MDAEKIRKMLDARAAARASGQKPKPPASPRQAIKAKCKDCIYDPGSGGTALDQINACTTTSCALWPFRPVRRPVVETPGGSIKDA